MRASARRGGSFGIFRAGRVPARNRAFARESNGGTGHFLAGWRRTRQHSHRLGRPQPVGRRRPAREAEEAHLRSVGDQAALGVPQLLLDRCVAVAGVAGPVDGEHPVGDGAAEKVHREVGAGPQPVDRHRPHPMNSTSVWAGAGSKLTKTNPSHTSKVIPSSPC